MFNRFRSLLVVPWWFLLIPDVCCWIPWSVAVHLFHLESFRHITRPALLIGLGGSCIAPVMFGAPGALGEVQTLGFSGWKLATFLHLSDPCVFLVSTFCCCSSSSSFFSAGGVGGYHHFFKERSPLCPVPWGCHLRGQVWGLHCQPSLQPGRWMASSVETWEPLGRRWRFPTGGEQNETQKRGCEQDEMGG